MLPSVKKLAKREVHISRWWTLAFSAMIEVIAGVLYTFSVFSSDLKLHLGLTQEQIQTVATMINIGVGFGIPAGYVLDCLGPRVTILMGAVVTFMGYFFLWAVCSGTINQEFEALCIFAFLAGNANSWLDNTVVVTNAKNFPKQRSTVIGILSSLVGLSATVNTQIYVSFFEPDWIGFLLFISIGLAGIVIMCTMFVNEIHVKEDREDKYSGWTDRRMWVMEAAVLSLAAYLQVVSSVEHIYELAPISKRLLSGGMFVLLAIFWVVPFLWRHRGETGGEASQSMMLTVIDVPHPASEGDSSSDNSPHNSVSTQQTDVEIGRAGDIEKTVTTTTGGGGEESGATVKEALLDPKFWCITISLIAGSGAGVMVFNQIGQVVQSYGGQPGEQNAFVSALGISSCLGRLGVGVVSGKLEGKLPRPWLYFGGIVLMMLSQIAFAFSSLSTLYFGCVACGMALGSFFSVSPSMVADLFGLKHMGTIFSLILVAPMIGSLSMSRFLATSIYKAHTPEGSTVCIGRECFTNAFLLNALICAAGSALAFVLCLLSRPIYRKKALQPK